MGIKYIAARFQQPTILGSGDQHIGALPEIDSPLTGFAKLLPERLQLVPHHFVLAAMVKASRNDKVVFRFFLFAIARFQQGDPGVQRAQYFVE